MHSRIFQITKTDPSTHEIDIIDEERYYDFPDCDYTERIEDDMLEHEIADWIGDSRPGIECDPAKGTILVKSKAEALEPYYREWLDCLDKCKSTTLDEWMHPYGIVLPWQATKQAFSLEGGILFDDYDEQLGIATWQEFLRHSNDGDLYHIITVFDYHY